MVILIRLIRSLSARTRSDIIKEHYLRMSYVKWGVLAVCRIVYAMSHTGKKKEKNIEMENWKSKNREVKKKGVR